MKKILSLILAAIMALSCAAFVSADEAAEEANSFEGYALEFLVNKNIWKGVSAEELIADAESNVERWQMALLVSRVSTGWLDDEAWEDDVANDSTFTDLAGTVAENYLGAISYANQNGIIEGYSAEKFGPTDNITYRDGLTMAVRTLGYKGLAYPWGYIEKAVELGLTEGIDKAYTADLTRGEVACILYNALFAATKSGETLAKSIFDVDFGWETIVIVAGKGGYFSNYSAEASKCPDGYLAFKVLEDDASATLSSATYYVNAKELGLSTSYNEEKAALGAAYLALFEVADNGIVSLVEAHDLTLKTMYNENGKTDIRFELMKYSLVTKYNDTPYISDAGKPEIMLYELAAKEAFVVDKSVVAIDLDTLNILKKNGSKWTVEWWYDHVNDRYYKVVATTDNKVSVDFLDETVFEEWYAEAIKVAKKNTKGYTLSVDPNVDAPYAKLVTYDVNGDGKPDRALYNTYTLMHFYTITDWYMADKGAGYSEYNDQTYLRAVGLDDDDFANQREDCYAPGVSNALFGGTEQFIGFWWDGFDSAGLEVNHCWTFNFSDWCKERGYDSATDIIDKGSFIALASLDKTGRVMDIYKMMVDDKITNDPTGDENFTIINGMLKGYSIGAQGKSAKINIDGKVYNLGYEGLDGAVLQEFYQEDDYGYYIDTYINDEGKMIARWLNDHMYETLRYTIVGGKVVDIDMPAIDVKDEAIIVLGYAGITKEDNLIAVYGYSTTGLRDDINDTKQDIGVQIFKIASINGWNKGDYKYYPMNALTDAMFQPGSMFTINSYDAELDAYHVEAKTVEEVFADAATLQSVTFERGYMVVDGSVMTMSANDKYIFIDELGTIKVYHGIVTNDNWSIKNAKFIQMSEVYDGQGNLVDYIWVFFGGEVTGFSTVYQTDIVLFDEDSYVLNYTYDEYITEDAILAGGDYLLGSVQQAGVVVTNMMSGTQMTVRAANNIDFKVGNAYLVVGGVIISQLGYNNDSNVAFADTAEFMELAKSLYWDSEENCAMLTNDGAKYIIMDKYVQEDGTYVDATLTMTKGGTDNWWMDTDALAESLLLNNNFYGWSHEEIKKLFVVMGGYHGFPMYSVDANGKITRQDWMADAQNGKLVYFFQMRRTKDPYRRADKLPHRDGMPDPT